MEMYNNVVKITVFFARTIRMASIFISYRYHLHLKTWGKKQWYKKHIAKLFNDIVTQWSGTFGQILSQFQIWCLSAHQSMQYKTATFYIVFFFGDCQVYNIDTMKNLAIDPWQNVAVFCGQMIHISSSYRQTFACVYRRDIMRLWTQPFSKVIRKLVAM